MRWLFFVASILLFKPIYLFEDWAIIYALKLVNITATAFTSGILFMILKNKVDEKVAYSASLLFVFSTPVAYWTLSSKIHAISLLLIASSFYFLQRYLTTNKDINLFFSLLLAGFCFFSRSLDGLILSLSLLLFLLFFQREKIFYVTAIALGYLPCAFFSYLLFGIPLPVEIVGNRFSNMSYIEASSLSDIISILPFIFFGLNNSTLGMLSYSPILASLIFPIAKTMRVKKLQLDKFEKFLLLFTLTCFFVYLPFLKNGVVETGVRDYRFLLPIYLTLIYFIATRIKPELGLSAVPVAICFVATTIVATTLLNPYFNALKIAYLATSIPLTLLFVFIEKFNNRKDLFSLALLPNIFLVSDNVRAYFSPYDIHFLNPLLNRFVELLILLLGFT